MQTIETRAVPSGIGLQDILFILFKHKWKIIFFSLLGFSAAAAVYLTRVPVYKSYAKLLVRYVTTRGPLDPESSRKEPSGASGAAVINAEIDILTSQDLALEVAETIGPERLVRDGGPETQPIDGALAVQGGLEVVSGYQSNVLYLSFASEHRDLPKEVLSELVSRYRVKHMMIHRSVGAFDIVTEQIDQVRGRLSKAEEELKALNAKAEEIALADTTTTLMKQRSIIRQDLLAAETELGEQKARMDSLENSLKESEVNAEGKETIGPRPGIDELARYESLLENLKQLNQRKLELLEKYTARNQLVVLTQERIDEVEASRRALAKQFPGLVAEVEARNGPAGATRPDPEMEKARLAAIEARISILKKQQDEIERQFSELAQLESQIELVQRRKTREDEKYRFLEQSLEQARTDETLDPSKMPDISIVDHPSAPVRTFSELTKKLVLGLAGAGVAFGVGLALLIELVVDRRVMRPMELETRLHIPLMMSIPMARGGVGARLPAPRQVLAMRSENEDGEIMLPDVPEAPFGKPVPQEVNHFILPYADAIRDRLFYYFELNDMTHKPKLVAVTGLGKGAGASTIAAGLATAFSQMEDSKVLLVDMNTEHDEANPIFEGQEPYSLMGALKAGRGVEFKQSPENLYLASGVAGNGTKGSKQMAPRKLFDLMPVFRASEYDYIIFDMPPTGPTSPTLAMAGFMDQVLLVLDAKNTNRDALKRTHAELVQGKAEVSCIFNKTRSHAPRWVQGEV